MLSRMTSKSLYIKANEEKEIETTDDASEEAIELVIWFYTSTVSINYEKKRRPRHSAVAATVLSHGARRRQQETEMNIFRLSGDLSHLLAILLLLVKIWKTRSCAGISGKSQILFAIVYTTRYLDLFTSFVSVYNSFMKVVFLTASYGTLYLMFFKFKPTYDHNHDSFRILYLIIPSLVLSFIIVHVYTVMEILWTYSIYLEAVAIMPQLFMVSRTGEAETITSHYLFALGSYRALYILNWIYRYYTEDFLDMIVIIAGIVQTILYCDFFYLYITKVLKGKRLSLPV
ncbi:ER lumen protein-retaining receptor [Aphis craccivora]|uniref:ER lumen protein-retaining receptor n=1 Tax=Aphis craccivora TaxID=307492 RepID=A0A6G0YR29_APHCR|nr:ER lumen protein-retaining receptor [Aphis craccivora]